MCALLYANTTGVIGLVYGNKRPAVSIAQNFLELELELMLSQANGTKASAAGLSGCARAWLCEAHEVRRERR